MKDAADHFSSPMTPAVLEAVSNLTIEVRKVVEGLLGGGHASLHHGVSVEFAEHKEYRPGDDIRNIDWRALARTDRYFIKTHEREVTLKCLMLFDCSPSMGYRGQRATHSKIEYAKVLLGAMAHVLIRQGDAVGLLPFADKPLPYLPPERMPRYLPSIINRLVICEPASDGNTGYAETMKKAADIVGQRSMIAIVSDFWGMKRDAEITLASLAARGHDIALFRVFDPDELDLDFDGVATFQGLEGEGKIEIESALVREDYRRALHEDRKRVKDLAARAEIDVIESSTDSPPETALAEFASKRHRTWRQV